MADNSTPAMIDPTIFQFLQSHAEQDIVVNEKLHQITAVLNRQTSTSQGHLSRIHATPTSKLAPLLSQVEKDGIQPAIASIGELAAFASNYPYYKYNQRWSRGIQNLLSQMLLTAWLGGLGTDARPGELGRLLRLEEVGEILKVPVNLTDRDAFHITIEEYLLAMTDMTEELSRLAMNAVTLGDVELTVRISAFVKDLFAGFQLLNLKNDILRRKVDGVKYHVKKVEDVIYDLTLRNLIPKKDDTAVSKMEVEA